MIGAFYPKDCLGGEVPKRLWCQLLGYIGGVDVRTRWSKVCSFYSSLSPYIFVYYIFALALMQRRTVSDMRAWYQAVEDICDYFVCARCLGVIRGSPTAESDASRVFSAL